MDTHFDAWLAGFFDGEGCISLQRRTGQLLVVIGQSERGVLEQIQTVYGGNLGLRSHKGTPLGGGSRYKTTKDHWQLQFPFWESRTLLQAMFPYLVVKRAKAQLALDYIATTLSLIGLRGGRKGGTGHRLTGIEREARASFYRRLQALDLSAQDADVESPVETPEQGRLFAPET